MDTPGTVEVKQTGNCTTRTKIAVVLAGVVVAFCLARVHLIVGGDLSVPRIVIKKSLGFSETLVDIDKIAGMPRMFAYAQFPIGVKVLQREGIIETEEEFNARVEREVDEEFAGIERTSQDSMMAADAAFDAAMAAADAAADLVVDAEHTVTSQMQVDPEHERQAAIDAHTRELQLLHEFDKAVGGDLVKSTSAAVSTPSATAQLSDAVAAEAPEPANEARHGAVTDKATVVPQFADSTPYTVVRQEIIANGWKPVVQTWEAGGIRVDSMRRSYPETENCTDAGRAFCLFIFENDGGNVLRVVTGGEEEQYFESAKVQIK